MGFQQTVNIDVNLGVPGDLILDEPYRITPVTLAANGYLGYFFSVANNTGLASPGVALAAGSIIFGGIAVLSKDEPLFGSSAANPLNPNLEVFANAQVALMSMGSCVVSIPNSWEEGDYVQYSTTTGALATYAPSGSPTGGYAQVPNAIMVRFGAGGGLGIARLTN